MTAGTFLKIFRPNPKVPENWSDNPSRRPGLRRKKFANDPKVCENPADNWFVGERGAEKIENIFRIDPKVPEKVDDNQHRRGFLSASAAPKAALYRTSPSALFIGARPRFGRVCQTNTYGSSSPLPDEKSRHPPIVEKFPHGQNLSHRQHTTPPNRSKRRDGK
jgi:hypothetical protein